jgi:hypothetical protein
MPLSGSLDALERVGAQEAPTLTSMPAGRVLVGTPELMVTPTPIRTARREPSPTRPTYGCWAQPDRRLPCSPTTRPPPPRRPNRWTPQQLRGGSRRTQVSGRVSDLMAAGAMFSSRRAPPVSGSTCRSPPATPTPAPPCAATEPARTSAATPPTPSPRAGPRHPNPQRHVRSSTMGVRRKG